MKNILLLACAAIALSMGASAALADDNRYYDNGYYDNGDSSWEDNGWRYQYQDDGNYSDNSRQRDWNNGGYNYRHNTVSPRSIVLNLQRNDYRYISRPVLSGRFYQVKAVNPRGHNVKLYIDRYSGQIAKVKS
jgi:opacity protein-like surface antigen